MMSTVVSKRYDAAAAKVDREKPSSVEEAIATLKGMPAAKFDESVDLSFRLGVDPKHADQMVRGAVVLPNGIGKDRKSTRLNSSHSQISYAVFCLKKKKNIHSPPTPCYASSDTISTQSMSTRRT